VPGSQGLKINMNLGDRASNKRFLIIIDKGAEKSVSEGAGGSAGERGGGGRKEGRIRAGGGFG
jgi:hypothetical protein